MIIRESPSPRKVSGEQASWPPKSAREALWNSPSRQKRMQSADRTDASPSPSKRRRLDHTGSDTASGIDEEDDEETVQLKLQAIEARLKLKKLQKSKQKLEQVQNDNQHLSRSKRRQSDLDEGKQPPVQVPVSPKPQRNTIEQSESPRRVQLGIDKGLRAENVSLKKAPVAKTQLARAPERNHKSFSARLADSRSQQTSKKLKEEEVKKRQSKGFGLSKAFEEKNSDGATLSSRSPAVDAIENSRNAGKENACKGQMNSRHEKKTAPDQTAVRSSSVRNGNTDNISTENTKSEDAQSNNCEAFSGFELSTRKITHSNLEKAFENKPLISIRKLLKTVTSPNYDPPDVEDDYVVMGIIASKSLPRNHIPQHQIRNDGDQNADSTQPPRSKFMVLRLTDLEWELDMFLFDTAFDRFWKLTVGTVVAILNPGIMPPKPHMRESGQFSLKMASSEDTILEIGSAAQLGFCKSVKKDGKECAQWIDARKTEFCDFHVNLRIERARAGRMEINGMANLGVFGGAKRGGQQGRGRGGSVRGDGRKGGLKREGAYFDRSVGETAYSIPREFSGAISTSRKLDAEDYVQGGLSKAERSRKRLAEREKERSLTKALSSQGSGQGSEYMRLRQGSKDDAARDRAAAEGEAERADATTLGLVRDSARDVKLSPARQAGQAKKGPIAEPMGWSGAFKRGLLSPSKKVNRGDGDVRATLAQDGEKSQREASPGKKARFLLEEKGVRVPGRESTGDKAPPVVHGDNDEDDDGLDII